VGFGVTDQQLIRHQLSTIYRFKESLLLIRREVLHNILIEFGIPMKLFRLIKMCLSKTHSNVRIVTYLSDCFPIQDGLQQ
jgi:hypothetical protein